MAITQFHIPNPCHEDWSKMSPTEKGAFCSSCQKEVYDFTNLSRKEIKSVVETVTNPCVRIQQHKLDELNFIEWFNHLILRKKLKYIFLFSFILVFSGVYCQDSCLIQPQYIELDKEDEKSYEQILTENEELDEIEEQPISLIPTIEWIGTYYPYPEWDFPILISGGMMGSITVPEDRYPGDDGFYDIVPYQNEIALSGNSYEFMIDGDSLIFSINALFEQEIQLSIRKDLYSLKPYPFKNSVYFQKLLIHPGKQTIKFPLKDFVNGAYTIRMESEKEDGAIKLMYW
jgi:hypothetical protein